MSKFWNYVLQRLCERSTWLGLIGLATAAGVNLYPDQIAAITSAGVAIAGAILTFTADKTPAV